MRDLCIDHLCVLWPPHTRGHTPHTRLIDTLGTVRTGLPWARTHTNTDTRNNIVTHTLTCLSLLSHTHSHAPDRPAQEVLPCLLGGWHTCNK